MSQPRHILWINSAADWIGGCETYVRSVAAELSARGYRNTLLYDPNQPFRSEFAASFEAAFPLVDPALQIEQLRPDIVYVHRLANERLSAEITRGPARTLRFLHDHRLFCLREHKYTTLGNQTCTRVTGWNCYACLGCFHRSQGSLPIGVRTLGELRREQRGLRAYDRLIVGSDYFRDHLLRHGFESKQVVTTELFARRRDVEEATVRIPGRLVFAGTLVRGKGLGVLLHALRDVTRPWSLDVLGQGRQQSALEQLARTLGIDQQVRFLGACDGAAVLRHLAQAQALVFPSITPETFGLVGVEALSVGTPVIASDVGGIRQWLDHGRNGLLVPPNDSQALTHAIDRLLADPQQAAQWGQHGYQQSTARWTLSRGVDAIEAVMRGLFAPDTTSPIQPTAHDSIAESLGPMPWHDYPTTCTPEAVR